MLTPHDGWHHIGLRWSWDSDWYENMQFIKLENICCLPIKVTNFAWLFCIVYLYCGITYKWPMWTKVWQSGMYFLQEVFIKECIIFLKKRCSHLQGKEEAASTKTNQPTNETVTTILASLQGACSAGNVSSECTEAIMKMLMYHQKYLQMTGSQPPAVNPPLQAGLPPTPTPGALTRMPMMDRLIPGQSTGGSPAFPPQQPPGPGKFNSMQSLTSQLQGEGIWILMDLLQGFYAVG